MIKTFSYAFLLSLITITSAHAELSNEMDGHIYPNDNLIEVEVFIDMDFERIIDGDTFEASGKKVRLWGIDAPEKEDPAGWASTNFLKVLLGENNGALACKLVDIDRYRRSVMHCFIDGLDVGSMMVQMGMATDYKKYSGGYYQYEEQSAKEAGRGIWKPDEENK